MRSEPLTLHVTVAGKNEHQGGNLENAMAYIRLPLGVRIAMEFDLNGKRVINVYHVTTSDPIISAKLESLAVLFKNWFEFQLSQRLSDEISLVGVTALNLNVEFGEKWEEPVVPAIPGVGVIESVPNNVALVVSLKTALTGRSFQGRSYIAGLTEATVAQNVISTSLAAAIILDYGILANDLTIANAQLVVGSFQSAGVPRAVGVATPVDSFRVNTRVDTQRRRLPT